MCLLCAIWFIDLKLSFTYWWGCRNAYGNRLNGTIPRVFEKLKRMTYLWVVDTKTSLAMELQKMHCFSLLHEIRFYILTKSNSYPCHVKLLSHLCQYVFIFEISGHERSILTTFSNHFSCGHPLGICHQTV